MIGTIEQAGSAADDTKGTAASRFNTETIAKGRILCQGNPGIRQSVIQLKTSHFRRGIQICRDGLIQLTEPELHK